MRQFSVPLHIPVLTVLTYLVPPDITRHNYMNRMPVSHSFLHKEIKTYVFLPSMSDCLKKYQNLFLVNKSVKLIDNSNKMQQNPEEDTFFSIRTSNGNHTMKRKCQINYGCNNLKIIITYQFLTDNKYRMGESVSSILFLEYITHYCVDS